MEQYHALLKDILANGEVKDDRTGVGTISVFARQLRFDLKKGFPAVTTKRLAWKAVVGELLWFLEGSSDERRLAEITHGTSEGTVTIWTPNALAPYWKDKAKFTGDLGRVYGVQWRSWRKYDWSDQANTHVVSTVDQIAKLVEGLKKDPNSRRHIVVSYNPGEIDEMALPPCHAMFQMYVSNNKLSCQMYQRSADAFLGVPFNIASYALLTHMIAQVCGMEVGELVIVLGDAHIYKDHIEQVKQQLARSAYKLPKLHLNAACKDITKFTMADIKLENYQSHGSIAAKMAV